MLRVWTPDTMRKPGVVSLFHVADLFVSALADIKTSGGAITPQSSASIALFLIALGATTCTIKYSGGVDAECYEGLNIPMPAGSRFSDVDLNMLNLRLAEAVPAAIPSLPTFILMANHASHPHMMADAARCGGVVTFQLSDCEPCNAVCSVMTFNERRSLH